MERRWQDDSVHSPRKQEKILEINARKSDAAKTGRGNIISMAKDAFDGRSRVYENETRLTTPSARSVAISPSLTFSPARRIEYITAAETASLHCRLVTTFRFFADDFFHGAFSSTLGQTRPEKPHGAILSAPKTNKRSLTFSLCLMKRGETKELDHDNAGVK